MENEPTISNETLYKVAFDTRNFEIELFWRRSNYFLILNTAIATGFFTLRTSEYKLPLAVLGFVVAILWLGINLGGKFWQSRWEHRLEMLEKKLNPIVPLFSVNEATVRDDVKKSMNFFRHSRLRKIIDWLVLKKPSVSLIMIILSIVFILFWSFLIYESLWQC